MFAGWTLEFVTFVPFCCCCCCRRFEAFLRCNRPWSSSIRWSTERSSACRCCKASRCKCSRASCWRDNWLRYWNNEGRYLIAIQDSVSLRLKNQFIDSPYSPLALSAISRVPSLPATAAVDYFHCSLSDLIRVDLVVIPLIASSVLRPSPRRGSAPSLSR